MHPLDPLNGSKTRLIDVHAEAFALDVIGVASGRIIVIDKLSTAFDADVILLTFFLAVLTDMSRSTLGREKGKNKTPKTPPPKQHKIFFFFFNRERYNFLAPFLGGPPPGGGGKGTF